MKAARFYDKFDIRVEEVEEPKPKAGQVMVDVEWCGICGSDIHEYLLGPSTSPTKEKSTPDGIHVPVTLGHELCGRIRNPPPGSKFKEGDAVFVDPRILCRSCLPCKTGHSHCCRKLGYIGGTTGFGGYGEKVAADENSLYLLPPAIQLAYAAVIEPLAVVNHAIKVSGITTWKDRDALVVGGGPIGFALLLILKALGATNVIVSEPTEARRKQVAEFSRAVLNPLNEKVDQRVLDLTNGKGAEVVFDCAGVPAGMESAIDSLRYQGLYVMVAVWEKPINIPCWKFLGKHLTIKGTLIFGDDDVPEVMAMMKDGKLLGYEKMVTGRITVDDLVEKGLKELINNKDDHIKILVRPRSLRDSVIG